MKLLRLIVSFLIVVTVLAGCASSKVTSRHEYSGGKIARPDHIFIYDFAATPTDVVAESALRGQYAEHSTPQTAEQIATGRRVGAEIAKVLAEDIRNMGLSAERASNQTRPQIGDLVIRGYLLSVDEGSAVKRFTIGFSSGASHLKAMAEGFLVTNSGLLRKLGSGTVDSGGGKSPGAALGVIGTIATANPAGLIISTAIKIHGETSGSSTVEGRVKDMAKEISEIIEVKFKEQGWI